MGLGTVQFFLLYCETFTWLTCICTYLCTYEHIFAHKYVRVYNYILKLYNLGYHALLCKCYYRTYLFHLGTLWYIYN